MNEVYCLNLSIGCLVYSSHSMRGKVLVYELILLIEYVIPTVHIHVCVWKYVTW